MTRTRLRARPFGLCAATALASVAFALRACSGTAEPAVSSTTQPVIIDAEATTVLGQNGSFTSATANLGARSASSLSGPSGVVAAPDGVFVADTGNHRVLHFPAGAAAADRVYGQGGDFTSGTASSGGVSASSLSSPAAVGFLGASATDAGPPSDELYVVDTGNHRVLVFSGSATVASRVYGQPDSTSGAPGSPASATSLWDPSGLAVGGGGELYVADKTDHRVLHYAAGTTAADRVYGQLGDFTTRTQNKNGIGPSTLNAPTGVAIDPSGGVYVADTGNRRVLHYPAQSTVADRVYGQAGSFFTSIANVGGISSASLAAPTTLYTEGSSLWLSDQLNHRVLRMTGTGTTADHVLGQLGSFTTGAPNQGGLSARSLKLPAGVSADASGTFWVADPGNHRVLGYAASCVTSGCDDDNDCTDDSCEPSGTCSHTALSTAPPSCNGYACDPQAVACRTSCADTSECASEHSCVLGRCTRECTAASECAPGDACADGWCCDAACGGSCRACDSAGSEGTCTLAPSGSDPDGECHGGICDGAGLCTSGCSVIADCAADWACNDGVCTRECDAPADCNGAACVDGACCGVDACPEGQTCNFDATLRGHCVGANGSACSGPDECGSAECVDGVCCDEACDGPCRSCNLQGSIGTCADIAEGGDPEDECAPDYAVCGGQCDGQGGCRTPAAGTACIVPHCTQATLFGSAECDGQGACGDPAGTPCPDGFGCTDDASACRSSCTLNAHCADGATCVGGDCVTAIHPTCSSDAECAGKPCVDGYCCNAECGGECESCGVEDKEGFCTAVPDGTDPAGECSASGDPCVGLCNGARACEPAPAGTECRAAACDGPIILARAAECDGTGKACPESEQEGCSPGVCENAACVGGCKLDTDCAGGARCIDGACQEAQLDAGCGCSVPGRERASSVPLVLLLVALGLRRRAERR